MIAYRLLSNADFDSLHECFLTAFSDYEVDMRMSREQFRQRLMRDGIRMEISAGAFDGERMIGFCMNAVGEWQGKTTAYDGGSAMIPEYRGRGIATEMFAFLEPKLKDAGVSQYLLEVLTSNVAAANLYRKLGFVETRRLAVFRSQKGTKGTEGTKDLSHLEQLKRVELRRVELRRVELRRVKLRRVELRRVKLRRVELRRVELRRVELRRVEQLDWELFQTFWDGYPSWQNSIDAVDRVADERIIMGAYAGEACIGYGVVYVPQMNLLQLAVSPQHRRQGIGSTILAALETTALETTAIETRAPLKINNIDKELKGTLAFFESNGYNEVLGQYEMIKTL